MLLLPVSQDFEGCIPIRELNRKLRAAAYEIVIGFKDEE
jgi:hypothetical protein